MTFISLGSITAALPTLPAQSPIPLSNKRIFGPCPPWEQTQLSHWLCHICHRCHLECAGHGSRLPGWEGAWDGSGQQGRCLFGSSQEDPCAGGSWWKGSLFLQGPLLPTHHPESNSENAGCWVSSPEQQSGLRSGCPEQIYKLIEITDYFQNLSLLAVLLKIKSCFSPTRNGRTEVPFCSE